MSRLPIDRNAPTLAGDGAPRPIPEVAGVPGLLVEVANGSFVGGVVSVSAREVVLQDRRGRARRFANDPGAFFVDDVRVRLIPPPSAVGGVRAIGGAGGGPAGGGPAGGGPAGGGPAGGGRSGHEPVSNSGSVPVRNHRARVARASRIMVEGVHDAALVEQVWGHDLRVEGIVVEVLHGADDLAEVVRDFQPGPRRHLGILLDHLIPGSKEQRLAATIRDPHVLITGHPFVDVWSAVRPQLLGIERWPEVPRGEDYKAGLARRLGHAGADELWHRIRTSVRTWHDLDRSLIRAVEELIDFVTIPPDPAP